MPSPPAPLLLLLPYPLLQDVTNIRKMGWAGGVEALLGVLGSSSCEEQQAAALRLLDRVGLPLLLLPSRPRLGRLCICSFMHSIP